MTIATDGMSAKELELLLDSLVGTDSPYIKKVYYKFISINNAEKWAPNE